MKNRTAKILFLLALYAALHFGEACRKDAGINCQCPNPEFAHFDYCAIRAVANDPAVAPNFTILVTADSIEFVAQAAPLQAGFSLISSAMACSCLEDGYAGDKFPIQQLDIFADRDFNDMLPAGVSLNPVFYALLGGDAVVPLAPGQTDVSVTGFGLSERQIELFSYDRPASTGVPYRFTIQIIKTSGDTLRAQTGEVYF